MKSMNCYWIGIDWGESEHYVHVYQAAPGFNKKCRFPHSPQGLDEIVSLIKSFDEVGGVAVESANNLLVVKLLQSNFPVYKVNPKMSSDWRKAVCVSEVKSDGGDARLLAEGIWHYHAKLVAAKFPDENIIELQQLCDDEAGFIQDRTRNIQQLKALIKAYHPHMLNFFSDWASPVAWDFLLRYPTPQKLARAREKSVIDFLHSNNIGISKKWRTRIDERKKALDWPQNKMRYPAIMLKVETLVFQLKILQTQLIKYRNRIEELFEKFESKEIFKSLPGAGPKLAPRMAVIFNSDCDEVEGIRQLAGVAPITKQSGNKRSVFIRWACKKKWRNAMHLYAHQSMIRCNWARAFYKVCRNRGDSHSTALRKLAGKWIKIIHQMWKTKTIYDGDKYVQQLKKKNSPTYQYMKQNLLTT